MELPNEEVFSTQVGVIHQLSTSPHASLQPRHKTSVHHVEKTCLLDAFTAHAVPGSSDTVASFVGHLGDGSADAAPRPGHASLGRKKGKMFADDELLFWLFFSVVNATF